MAALAITLHRPTRPSVEHLKPVAKRPSVEISTEGVMKTKRFKPSSSANVLLLKISEAAELLRVEVSTLYQWVHERRIPVVKLGRSVRFRRSVILKLISDCERPAIADPEPEDS